MLAATFLQDVPFEELGVGIPEEDSLARELPLVQDPHLFEAE